MPFRKSAKGSIGIWSTFTLEDLAEFLVEEGLDKEFLEELAKFQAERDRLGGIKAMQLSLTELSQLDELSREDQQLWVMSHWGIDTRLFNTLFRAGYTPKDFPSCSEDELREKKFSPNQIRTILEGITAWKASLADEIQAQQPDLETLRRQVRAC